VEERVDDILSGPGVRYNFVSSVDLLKLALGMVDCGSLIQELIDRVVDFAVEQIETWDELEYLSENAEDFNLDLTQHDVQEKASEVLRFQLDYLSDENDDIDEVSQGADNIVNLAYEYGLDWSARVEVLHEKVSQMPEDSSPVSGPRYRPPPESERVLSDEDAVRELFQGLVD
jgi:hypothetical protein